MKKILITIILLIMVSAVYGMTQRTAFQKLRAHAKSRAFTPEQIKNATKEQVQSNLDLTDEETKQYEYFWLGMKDILLRDAIERQTRVRLISFRLQVMSVYPDAVGLHSETVKEIAIQLLPYLYGQVDPNEIY